MTETTKPIPQKVEEFERQPVPKSHLKSWKSFLGMYAGEHAAERSLYLVHFSSPQE